MAKMMFNRPTWSLEVTQDVIDTTCGIDTLDPYWRATDSNGHEHYYDHAYVTLDFIVDASHWCDGTEGLYNHDPHEAIDESHYECLICREVVKPGIVPAYTPQSMPGMIDARLVGLRSDGATITMWLKEDEWKLLQSASESTRNLHAQRLLDEAGDDRISSMTFSR